MKIKEYSAYLISLACFVGYALTKHDAFLFIYAFICWFALVALVLACAGCWYAFSKARGDEFDKMHLQFVVAAKALKAPSKTMYFSWVVSAIQITLLLYWGAFATATPAILVAGGVILYRYFMINMFCENEQEPSA
jgi:hypothetical protein